MKGEEKRKRNRERVKREGEGEGEEKEGEKEEGKREERERETFQPFFCTHPCLYDFRHDCVCFATPCEVCIESRLPPAGPAPRVQDKLAALEPSVSRF